MSLRIMYEFIFITVYEFMFVSRDFLAELLCMYIPVDRGQLEYTE